LKQILSKTKIIHKQIGVLENLVHDIEHIGIKKEDIYNVENGELVKTNTIITKPKNVFSIYTESCYDLYKHVSIAVDHACWSYQINKSKQKYMGYAKNVKYYPDTNKHWYDFPGINVPFLHGFYFASGSGIQVKFNNNQTIHYQDVSPGDLIINKPTDLVNISVTEESNIVEFYVSPLFALKNNEPGVWVPII